MIKSVMILAPHPDDELNITGGLLSIFKKNKIDITIVFSTNGDYNKDNTIKRHKEIQNALKHYNANIILLGYADNVENNHLFYSDKEVWISKDGISETYGLNGIDDWSYIINGKHHAYNFTNLKDDVKSVIKYYNPDLIISVDCDNHPDHRTLSLAFDEVMGQILKDNPNYKPIVLKKYAYLGVWSSVKDYFEYPRKSTLPINNENIENIYDYTIPYYWEDRLRVATPKKECSLFFWKSKIFKSYLAYKTQLGSRYVLSTINKDIIYWYRNTNNLCLNANKVEVSSGDKRYLNDFMLVNMIDIGTRKTGYRKYDKCAWIPSTSDNKREIRFEWNEDIECSTIVIHQNFSDIGHINTFIFEMNGYIAQFESDNKDVQEFKLDSTINTNYLLIKVVDGTGIFGIREIEVFSKRNEFPWDEVPFNKYIQNKEERYNSFYKCLSYVSKKIYSLFLWFSKQNNRLRHILGLGYIK